MKNLVDDEIRVLLPARPEDDPAEMSRLLRSMLPPGVTHVRRFYVHRPLESDYFLPRTHSRFVDLPRLEAEAEAATRADMERHMSALAADGFRVSAEIVRGTPAEEVLREASLWRSDLVAVRTRSASARDNRVGGMASALLHHATCPVLTVPAVPEGYRLRRILIPVDFSPASRRGADWGLALAEVSGAVPVLLHIVGRWVGPHGFDTQELVEIAREELERWRAAGSPSLAKRARETHVLPADDVADGILRFTEEGEHDLVVMASTGASAVRAILVGSNARRVVRASSKPVLVVTASNRVSVEEFLEKQRRAERFDSLAAGVRAEAPAAALRVS